MRIAVIGLGKLGSVIASIYAAAGHEVTGVDLSASVVDAINRGVAPFQEPGLQQLIDQAGARLSATLDFDVALAEADASYIIVPTPSNTEGVFTNEYVVAALTDIGRAIRTQSKRHTVVICSTVMPGSCDGELRNALEEASGKSVGVDVGLVYSPEFIALGSIVRDMQHPDLLLIGESDPSAGDVVEANALSVTQTAPKVRRMNLVNAEIVKISINTFVTTKISFANMLGEICDLMAGGDVDTVTEAIGADSRIGTKYLKGALGYGGPCFPRDNIALTQLGAIIGVDAAIPRATDVINDRQVDRVVRVVAEHTPSGGHVAVLGLAYKPDTPVCEESQGIDIADKLAASGYIVSVFDPQANDTAAGLLNPAVRVTDSWDVALSQAATIIIATPWVQFTRIPKSYFEGRYVLDAWGILPADYGARRLGKLRAAESVRSEEKASV